jgi:hypothetical protein
VGSNPTPGTNKSDSENEAPTREAAPRGVVRQGHISDGSVSADEGLEPNDGEVRVIGRAADRDWDYRCDIVYGTPERVALRTRSEPSHVIELVPRFVGGKIGRPSPEGDGVVCNLTLDGDFVAFATYYEDERGILIVPEEAGG